MILIIDNYDSFVYNLFQEFKTLSQDVIVRRRGNLTLKEAIELSPDSIVISPGPGRPEDAELCLEIIKYFTGKIPILGVCLGHQCIAHAFEGKVIKANRVMHGITSEIFHDGKTIFEDLSNPFEATRYHSLIVSDEKLPNTLEVSAYTAEGEIMGIRVKGTLTEGVQFHPESFLTSEGKKIVRNFFELGGIR
ncbi:MAG: anthranilate synthase component II [Candidatus Aminicenantia bacterium]